MTTVSTSAFYERAILQQGGLRQQAGRLQQQIGSGERLTRSSDDPVAAARLRAISRQERLNDVNERSTDRVTADLRLADDALASVADIVIRARELALQAANTALSDDARANIAVEIDTLRDNLFSVSNRRDAGGGALFGGEANGSAYDNSGGVISYVGSASAPDITVGEGQQVTRSLTGPQVLSFTDSGGATTDLFVVLADLSAGLAGGGAAALAAAQSGLDGLDSGLERITNAQTLVGTRLNWLDTVEDQRTAARQQLANEQADIGGADLALTISRLQETLTVLEASQASFVRLSNLSLFNILN